MIHNNQCNDYVVTFDTLFTCKKYYAPYKILILNRWRFIVKNELEIAIYKATKPKNNPS